MCFLVPTCVHPPKERLLVLSHITLHIFTVQRSISGQMEASFVARPSLTRRVRDREVIRHAMSVRLRNAGHGISGCR